MTDISVCMAVHRAHPAPNAASLVAELPAALGGMEGEMLVALNGLSAQAAGVSDEVVAASFDLNRGVAVAWNAAATKATGQVVCFVNDDLKLGPESLKRLHDTLLAQPEAGVVSPVGAGWDMRRLRYRDWFHGEGLADGDVRACDVTAGFLFALRRETFERIGGFDEAYTPAGLEEVDLCVAVRERLGLQCYAVGGVEHAHEYGISAARPWQRIEFDGRTESIGSIHHRNKRHFATKWGVAMPRFDRVRHFAEIGRLAVARRLGR